MVYAGLYPVNNEDFEDLRTASFSKNCSSMMRACLSNWKPRPPSALVFACGFLGLLHMEIVQERLERQLDPNLITTAPNVVYRVTTTDGETLVVDTPPPSLPKAPSSPSRSPMWTRL